MSTFELGSTDLLSRGFEGFKSTSLEERIQELIDREEIRELAARYAQRVARRQSMADLFTDDGAFIVHMPDQPVQVVRGREQLEKTFAAAISSPALNMPAVHNQVISISGNDAAGTSWIELYTLDGGSGALPAAAFTRIACAVRMDAGSSSSERRTCWWLDRSSGDKRLWP